MNEKLEGFFELCKAKGPTGKQGAVIPASNVQNLMLKDDLLEAAKSGNFAIYPARTIDEGTEFLTGVPAGERQPDGPYREGTVNYLVNKRLQEMAEKNRKFQSPCDNLKKIVKKILRSAEEGFRMAFLFY